MPEANAGFAEKLAELRAGFKPLVRRSTSSLGGSSAEGDGDGEGAGVRVVVRCLPTSASAGAAAGGPLFQLLPEPQGRDSVSLRVEAPREALEALGAEGGRSFRCNTYFGPEAAQEDIFAEAAPIVEAVMRGGNGTVLCYGVTGSGKTYTMSGPPEDSGVRRDTSAVGIIQRVSKRIFEYIRDRSMHGEVFVVEVSYLQIYSSNGTDIGEQLIDLLAEDERELEVTQDPLNPQSFICEGLNRVPIRTPDELCEMLNSGQRRGGLMEAQGNYQAGCSHCLFTLMIESLADQQGSGEPLVLRGKLVLADLAGSETRTLASLSAMVARVNGAAPGHDSALTMLLRDSLGGNSRALLVANIALELQGLEESVKTLSFGQQMMAVKSAGSSANRNSQDRGSSSLLQMRKRHSECIRMLQDKVSATQEEEQQERQRLQKEMEDLNKRLLTKESAEQTLGDMRDEQLRKIDQMKEEMALTMTKELEKMREHSLQDLNNLRQSVEQHVTHLSASQLQQQAEEQEARVERMQVDIQEAMRGQRVAEEEAADLRVRLASVEERAKMLQARQEELRQERSAFDEERRDLRQQSEQQWQKLMAAENDLQRCKAEAEVQRAELSRLAAARAEEEEAARRERESWRTRESELQQEMVRLRSQVEEAKREAEVQQLRAQAEQKEATGHLKLQLERLEDEAASRKEQLQHAQSACARLEAEKEAARQREEALRQHTVRDMQQYQEEIEEARAREAELMQMLSDIQDNIITASTSSPKFKGG